MISIQHTTLVHDPSVSRQKPVTAVKELEINGPVAYMATTRNIGGLERIALRLAGELVLRGADVRFLCRPQSQLSRHCAARGLRQHNLVVRNSVDYVAAKTIAQYLIDEDIAILHVHSRRDFVPSVIAVKIAAKKMPRRPLLVLHVHQIRRLGDGGWVADSFFNWGADKVLAVSHAVKRAICEGSHVRTSLVDVLMNGVDHSEFAAPGSAQARDWRQMMRRRWHIDEDVPVIGMVGRLDQKGQEFLVSKLPALLKCAPNAQLVVIGPDRGDDFRKRLRRLAVSNRTLDRIVFAGVVANMPAAYAAMDVLVHLPLDEAFGLAPAEAMAASLPVVVSNIGGCREVVRHMETGLLIEPRSGTDLVHSIRLLLDDPDRALGAKLGSAAKQSISDSFSSTRQLEELIGVYEQLMRAVG